MTGSSPSEPSPPARPGPQRLESRRGAFRAGVIFGVATALGTAGLISLARHGSIGLRLLEVHAVALLSGAALSAFNGRGVFSAGLLLGTLLAAAAAAGAFLALGHGPLLP